jgi:hypothetical protein
MCGQGPHILMTASQAMPRRASPDDNVSTGQFRRMCGQKPAHPDDGIASDASVVEQELGQA